jgi:hypothetical protein
MNLLNWYFHANWKSECADRLKKSNHSFECSFSCISPWLFIHGIVVFKVNRILFLMRKESNKSNYINWSYILLTCHKKSLSWYFLHLDICFSPLNPEYSVKKIPKLTHSYDFSQHKRIYILSVFSHNKSIWRFHTVLDYKINENNVRINFSTYKTIVQGQ